MDFADIGSETTERATADAIAKVQQAAQIKRFPLIGKCYNCEASLVDRPFCSTDCREDYEEVKQRISRR